MSSKSRNLWPNSWCSVTGSCLNHPKKCDECFKKDKFKSLRVLKNTRYINREASEEAV